MNGLIKTLVSDKIIRLASVIAGGLLVFHLGYILLFFNSIPPVIPLFNQLPWGEDRLGEKIHIFIPLILAVVMVAINLTLSSILYEKMPLISRILSIMNLLLSLLSAIFIFRIMQLVI